MNNQLTEQNFEPVIVKMQDLGMDVIQIKKEIAFALQLFAKNPKLFETTPDSKLAAVTNVAAIGLTLNPVAKEACLIPRWNKSLRANECALEPYYVGLVKLLTDAGSIISMVTNVVHENDYFEINLADNQKPVTHKPELVNAKRGEILGVYSLATLPDGTKQVEWIDKEELYKIRNRSETYLAYVEKKITTCTWVTDEKEMMRKSCVKRIYKYLPRTERMAKVDEAIGLDNSMYSTESTSEEAKNPVFKLPEVIPIPEELKAVISEADKDGLKNIYTTNPDLHSNKEFMKLLTERKNQLNANTVNA